tara:strand:+ start:4159 stop:5787 length:1629 start_codon:yes stop_codon:yes gene_type:complete
MTLTQITEKGIKDGEIVNADINASAAIAGSKINPIFTSNIEVQNNAPGITFTDSNDSHQFYIQTDGDALNLVDATGSTTKLGISNTGHITLRGNVTVNDGYFELANANLYINENITHAGDGDTRIRFPANDAISLETAGSSRLYIDSTGNAGINISTPQSLLELSAATDTVMGIELGRAGDSITASRYIGICQTNNATNLAVNSGFSGVEFGGPASTREAYVAFHTHDTGVGSGERMCIDKSGLVGIGTASPDRLIHAVGATPILKLDSTNNEAYVQFVTASPSNTFYIGLVDSDVILQSSGASSTTSENLRIKANGRVGINSASPSGTLSISDPNGDNVTVVLHTSASTNYIQLIDSANGHSYIGKEGNQTSFYTANAAANGTEKVAFFNTNGINLTAGKGIMFHPHDSTPTTNGSDSNFLDDYEEGTYAPADASGAGLTLTNNTTATYTKIGRMVYVQFDITYPSNSNSAAAGFSLPFTMAYNYGSGVMGWTDNGKPLFIHVGGYAYIMDNNNAVGSVSQHAQNAEVAGKRLIGSFWYIA